MSSKKLTSIAIIGGSIGGLTTGLLLKDLGYQVKIYERSPKSLFSRGAGIVVHNMTTKYFTERAGIDLEKVSTPSHYLRYFDKKGKVIFEEEREYHFTAWNALYRELKSLFNDDDYLLGYKMIGFTQNDEQVHIEFENGEVVSCDLMVSVDGVGSTARSILNPEAKLTYGGYVGWRGVAGEDEVSKETFEALNEAIAYQVIPNSHIVMYPIPALDGTVTVGKRLLNYVWYRNIEEGSELNELLTDTTGSTKPISLPPGQVQQKYIDEMRAFAEEHLAPPLAEVVSKTKEPFLQAMFDLEVDRMVYGRVILMGDGAFAARPHAAAGTAKAAADAWALSESLEENKNDFEAALKKWERRQLEVGSKLVKRSRNTGRKSQFENNWIPGDPSLHFGLFGPGD